MLICLAVLVLVNHYFWFRHFSEAQSRSLANMRSIYDQPDVPSFAQIASYFGICVWLVPFALFVSLSANDNVLPTMGTEGPRIGPDGKNKRQGMVKAVVDNVLGAIGEVFKAVGLQRSGSASWDT